MHEFVSRIVLLWGWRRVAVAMLAGAVSVLAFAPFGLFPILFVTFPVLIWLLDGAAPKAGSRGLRRLLPAAVVGWSFGFGYFLAGLHWVGGAFLVESEGLRWAAPVAVVALPAGLALVWAFAAMLARLLWSEDFRRILAFAAAFTMAEWVRGHIFTGFPWLLPGYALTATDSLAQSASLFGAYGLTWASCAIFAAPGAVSPRQTTRSGLAYGAVALVALVCLGVFGWVRLDLANDVVAQSTRVRIIQPNIAQNEKWNPAHKDRIFQTYLDLSDKALSPERAGIAGVDILVWPESAPPFVLMNDPAALDKIRALLPTGTVLLTGAIRMAPALRNGVASDVYNSILAFDHDAARMAHYDKVTLVPFGEYLPLKSVLGRMGLTHLAFMRGGYTAGVSRKTMNLPGIPPFSPLICYEIIFSGSVLDRKNRPAWLLNVTNDAWFGYSIGPYQHLHQARIRAIEEGIPVVRSANTGISAIIGPYGRTREALALNVAGVIDAQLPAIAAPTIFFRYGIQIVIGLVFLSLSVVLFPRVNTWRRNRYNR